MKTFINYFVNSSAVQLCILMVAPYMIYNFSSFGHNPMEWGLLVLYFLAVVLGWMYSIGITANSRLDPDLRLPAILFLITTILPFVSVTYFVIGVLEPFFRGEVQNAPGWLIYLHFLTFFCIGFNIWFAAKQFTTFRLNRKTSFADYYITFMCLWFGFVGVWYLQPKIVRVFARRDNPDRVL